MKIGKLPENVLERSVYKVLNHRRRAAQGYGYGAVKPEQTEIAVMGSVSLTDSGKDLRKSNIGRMAVNLIVNDIVVTGASPVGIMLTAFFPIDIKESHIKILMQEINEECVKLGIEVMDVNAEVTPAVNQTVLSVTGVAGLRKGGPRHDGGCPDVKIKPGFEIVITKDIALEGTSVLACAKENELAARFPKDLVETAKLFANEISVVLEAKLAFCNGAAFMNNLAESGVFGALWRMSRISGLGIEADLKKIPVRQETIEICNYFDINPYMLKSGGSLLIATEHGSAMADVLERAGIAATVIGRFNDDNDKKVINGEDTRYLEQPSSDELYKIIFP